MENNNEKTKLHNGLGFGLHSLTLLSGAKSRSLSAENKTGEKGCGGAAEDGTGGLAARDLGQGWKVSPSILLKAGETAMIADIAGEGVIKHIWMTDSSGDKRPIILRIYFDGFKKAAVETPHCDFFCAADYGEYKQISSLAVCVNPRRGFNSYFEMPFFKNFKITLENITKNDITVYYQIDYLLTELPANAGYFHAQFRRVNPLKYKTPYTILDNIKGRGQYVGTYLFWGSNSSGWWGEGEIKFFLDGDFKYPTICGTGTEDYFCGAYNFDVNGRYTDFSGPYCGFFKTKTDDAYRSQSRFSMYRFHIADPIYFEEDIKVTIQALGWREGGRYLPLMDDISSVAYWYSDNLDDDYPPLPNRDGLEII